MELQIVTLWMSGICTSQRDVTEAACALIKCALILFREGIYAKQQHRMMHSEIHLKSLWGNNTWPHDSFAIAGKKARCFPNWLCSLQLKGHGLSDIEGVQSFLHWLRKALGRILEFWMETKGNLFSMELRVSFHHWWEGPNEALQELNCGSVSKCGRMRRCKALTATRWTFNKLAKPWQFEGQEII